MNLKLARVNAVDEQHVDSVIRQFSKETKAIQYNNSVYDLGEYSYNKVVEHTSAISLRIISKPE